ncbi:MAG TPA: energy-coupling factor ABC transporter permease [Burkholderiales bacterium]|nr:energy-coupling factor ABC transporter permease [Burkholderiales bacterium]
MNLTAGLLPAPWYWVAHLTLLGVLIHVAVGAPWRQLADPTRLNVWLGSIVILAVLWSIRAGVRPGLGFHLLGATACTLLFGPRLAVAAMVLVVASQVAAGTISLYSASANALGMGVVPVAVSQAILRLVERRLPPNLFVYIFAAAFFGAALTMLATGALASLLLGAAGAYTFEYLLSEYLPWFVLLAWAEAFTTGAVITLVVIYRPSWIATFDDRRYLGKD